MILLTIHFKKPADWAGKPYIHYWPVTSEPRGTSTWPGVQMEQEQDGLFVFYFETASANFVFNDRQGRQTADLYREKDGWFNDDSQWYDSLLLLNKAFFLFTDGKTL